MSLKPILKLPEYVDEILDMLWYTLQAIKMYVRDEWPLSEALTYLFGAFASMLLASLVIRYINRKK